MQLTPLGSLVTDAVSSRKPLMLPGLVFSVSSTTARSAMSSMGCLLTQDILILSIRWAMMKDTRTVKHMQLDSAATAAARAKNQISHLGLA